MANKNNQDEYSGEETAQRRDEVIRWLANTPPQPKTITPHRLKKKKKAASVRVARKSPARRGG